MSKRAEEAALRAYDTNVPASIRIAYRDGHEAAEKDIIEMIWWRISEIIGDAQPKPILRAELQELIKRIKGDEK